MTLGDKIRKYRTLQDMTQKDLALISGYSYAYIRRLESINCIKKFSIQTVYDISIALNVEIKELFEDSDIL